MALSPDGLKSSSITNKQARPWHTVGMATGQPVAELAQLLAT